MSGTVLVTDAEQRAALAAVRSLGAAGYDVHVCSSVSRPLAGASRYTRTATRVPDPLTELDRYIDATSELAGTVGADLVLPIAEASIIPLLGASERFAPARIPFPQLEQFARISDKAGLTALAPTLGIAVPKQVVLERFVPPGEYDVSYPVVVKPARSVVAAGAGRMKLGVSHAGDASELRRTLEALPPDAYPVLLQERIVGPGVGIFLLRWEGRTLASMAHRRLREKPPSGGVSVYRETIPAPAGLIERSERLLDAFAWSGVAMVEYKLDGATGTPYLMEVNGRLWGSLQLAIDAGVDFPALLAAAALGRAVTPVSGYRFVRSRWWWGEIDHLVARWTRPGPNDESLPSRVRTTLDVLRPWHARCREEVFRWSDPVPFLRETRDWFRALGG